MICDTIILHSTMLTELYNILHSNTEHVLLNCAIILTKMPTQKCECNNGILTSCCNAPKHMAVLKWEHIRYWQRSQLTEQKTFIFENIVFWLFVNWLFSQCLKCYHMNTLIISRAYWRFHLSTDPCDLGASGRS